MRKTIALQTSPLDPYASAVQVWLNEGKSKVDIVRLLNAQFSVQTSTRSLDRLIDRHSLDVPQGRVAPDRSGVEFVGDDEAVVTSDALTSPGEIDDVIREYGLDPSEWVVERVLLNRWDANAGNGEKIPLKQFRISLKRRMALRFVMPAQDVQINLPDPKEFDRETGFLAVIVGDEQEPHGDPQLKSLFLNWLAENRPQIGVHLGDLMDLPNISRHKDNPEWDVPVQVCIDAGYKTLYERRVASPDTQWQLLVGNHDERLRNELLMRAERMYGIRPARIEGEDDPDEVLSVRNLLHLDALGVEYVAPRGGYAHAAVKLTPELSVRHGWLTGANAADRTLQRLGHSVIVGHSHRQSLTRKTIYDSDDRPKMLTAVEAGCMCQIEDGLGYVVNPDWQQGFATAEIYPDGTFSIDLATYSDGTLVWRDQRYTA